MKKIISFCLYGDNPLYTVGAIENLKLAKQIYPEWETHFYVAEDLDPSIVKNLLDLGGKLRIMSGDYQGVAYSYARKMYWRLLALQEPDLERVIFRDCDSRVSDKERQAVLAWQQSDRDFHFMYDHEWHTTPILGGMWGVKSGLIKLVSEEIEHFFDIKRDQLAQYIAINDQVFLKEVIWPKYVTANNYIAHGSLENCQYQLDLGIEVNSFPEHQDFPLLNGKKIAFVGQTIACPGATPKINKRELVG